jgi:hypothetical protein
MIEPRDFSEIDSQFECNVQALRVFSQQIGELADQHDRAIVEEFTTNLSGLLEIDLTAIPDEEDTCEPGNALAIETSSSTEAGVDSGRDIPQDDTVTPPASKTMMLEQVKRLFQDPDRTSQFIKCCRSFSKQSPTQGPLLRRSALVILASYFDLLFSDLIQSFYLRHPTALPSDEYVLSLADLRAIGSIEEAERYLITKESDKVLRRSLEDQLGYLSNRPKIDLEPLTDCINDLTELVQRRNLLIHNDGIVNRIYLARVPQSYTEANEIEEGQQLHVDPQYLSNAIETVYVAGIILIQQCWRKWEKEESEQADGALIDHIYESLLEKRHALTIRLAQYGSSIDFATDHDSRIVTINRAIALKELGEIEEMERVLSERDWSSCATKFRLALHVLRDEEGSVFELLPKAIAVEEVGRQALEEWPLFRSLRTNQRFLEAIEQYFPTAKCGECTA